MFPCGRRVLTGAGLPKCVHHLPITSRQVLCQVSTNMVQGANRHIASIRCDTYYSSCKAESSFIKRSGRSELCSNIRLQTLTDDRNYKISTCNYNSDSRTPEISEPVRHSQSTERSKSEIYFYFHPTCTEETKVVIASNFEVVPDFFSEEEEMSLMAEVEPHFKRQRYEFDHWDDAIVGFRETEVGRWSSRCTESLDRIRTKAFTGGLSMIHTHVLDLSEDGHIKPHIDSARFCGSTIAGVSLCSDAVMRLVKENLPLQMVDVWLPRRSLYVMRHEARYHFTHEVLAGGCSKLGEMDVPRTRRVSVICRNAP